MSEFNFEFDKLLGKIHHNMTKLEEKSLCIDRNLNLTVNELHLLECIKNGTKGDDGPTISAIASKLDITRPSTTVAVNKLTSKKYVEKIGCVNDGRSVRIKLTPKGEKAYEIYCDYRKETEGALAECFREDERKLLAAALDKINVFYADRLSEKESEDFEF